MADVYQRATAKIAALEREIAELKSWVAVYERLAAEPPDPKPLDLAMRSETAAAHGKFKRASDARKASDKDAILDAVERVLTAEQPLQAKALFERLAADGLTIPGADPVHNLINYLGRSKGRFTNKRGEGWRLVSSGDGTAGDLEPDRADSKAASQESMDDLA